MVVGPHLPLACFYPAFCLPEAVIDSLVFSHALQSNITGTEERIYVSHS